MIYLYTPSPASLGEDTFWTWFHREFPESTFDTPQVIGDNDIALVNCARNQPPVGGKSVGLVFELYPEMKRFLHTREYDSQIEYMRNTAKKCKLIAATSPVVVDDFADCGPVKVIPLGVNVDLFKILDNKFDLRSKYKITGKNVIFWSGNEHPMKGYDLLLQYNRTHPGIHWVLVWKDRIPSRQLPNASVFCKIPQTTIVELMNISDHFLCTNKLRPYFLVEWEAMACNLSPIIATTTPREFYPGKNPREDIFRLGWDRAALKKTWEQILTNV